MTLNVKVHKKSISVYFGFWPGGGGYTTKVNSLDFKMI